MEHGGPDMIYSLLKTLLTLLKTSLIVILHEVNRPHLIQDEDFLQIEIHHPRDIHRQKPAKATVHTLTLSKCILYHCHYV